VRLLRSMVNYINRQPIDTPAVEVTNTIYVIASRTRQKEALELVQQCLEQAAYPVSDLAIHAFGDGDVEIETTLAATSVDGDQLDELVRRLAEHPVIQQVFWSPSTTE
jgi:putative Mg2+ transporter-C (MgtC) family protein